MLWLQPSFGICRSGAVLFLREGLSCEGSPLITTVIEQTGSVNCSFLDFIGSMPSLPLPIGCQNQGTIWYAYTNVAHHSEMTVCEKMLKRIILLAGGGLSLILIWFAIGNYRASRPIAEENLRGLALSLASAIENIAVRDPSLKSLSEFHPTDIAFFAMINRHGVYRFHSNPDLIGNPAENSKAQGSVCQ